jgi:hypothetical protein
MPVRAHSLAVAVERVGQFILVIRRQRVLLDEDLAALYDVETGTLLQVVKRNIERFPPDFMFELSAAEWTALRSQSVTSKPARGGRRYAPYAFTEQGVAMLSSRWRANLAEDPRYRSAELEPCRIESGFTREPRYPAESFCNSA